MTARTTTAGRGAALDPAFDELAALTRDAAALAPFAPLADDDDVLAAPGDDHAPLRRYLWWQARDFVHERATWLVPLLLLVLWIAWYNYDPAQAQREYAQTMRQPANMRPDHVLTPVERLRESFLGGAVGLSFLGAVLATYGIVARERERGLQRFLFAKPVNAVRYYLQKLGVSGVGFLVVAAGAALAATLAFQTWLPIATALAAAAGIFAAVGGLTFLLSTITRFDAPIALAMCAAALPITGLAQDAGPRDYWWAHLLQWVLPPIRALDPVFNGLDARLMSAPGALVYAVAYGAVCVAAGVWVLRRRSIVT